MQIIKEQINYEKIPYIRILEELYPDKSIMMFDIETTGLSPDRSFIYLIGMNIKTNEGWNIVLLFNDDGKSEPDIITAFQEELAKHEILIEFNGDTFDINFVKRRMSFIYQKLGLSIPDNFSKVTTVDLLKLVRPYKTALGLPNIKQKTIERYLGINREDMYNGGQLIDVYLSYLMDKDPYSKKLVLQHNRDDMEGMLHLTQLFNIDVITKGIFDIEGVSTELKNKTLYLLIKINLHYPLPRSIFASSNGVSIEGEDQIAIIKSPILEDTLRYFYAVSKDSYEEKQGLFISQLSCNIDKAPAYKYNYKDKSSYIEICDFFLGNKDYLKSYVQSVSKEILSPRK